MINKFIKEINLKFNIIIIMLFSILFILGLYIFKDYGLTLDDEYYRQNGIFFLEYIKEFLLNKNFEHTNINIYKNVNMSTSPVIYDLFLAFLSQALNFNSSKEIYELSHLLNFTIFFISLIYFYKLLLQIFKDRIYSILGVLLIVFSPRIFAESFYNTRDILFMSLFIINIFYSFQFLKDQKFKNIIYFSIISGLCIAIKIFAILPFVLIIFLTFMDKINGEILPRKYLKNIFLVTILTLLFIIMFSPYMWENPIRNLVFFFQQQLSLQNQVNVTNFFMGEYFSSQNSPWFFRPLWFLMTTPITVIVFFIVGLSIYFITLSKNLLSLKSDQNIWKTDLELFYTFIAFILILTLFITIQYNSSNVDGWRHIYFLYPIVVLFSINGLIFLNDFLKKQLKYFIILLFLLNFSYIGTWMVINHPNQNVYFNYLSKNLSKGKFDLDYWGLSNYHSLKFLLDTDKNYPINVSTISFSSLEASKLFLSENDKENINIIYQGDLSEYIIDNYRVNLRTDKEKILKDYYIYHQIAVDGQNINTIYKKKK